MVPTVTEAQINTALRSFLLTVLPSGVEVFKGQQNLVPEPAEDNFVIMTVALRERLGRPRVATDDSLSPPTGLIITQPTAVHMQLDVHGELSSDNVQVIETTFWSPYACDWFRANAGFEIQPLYTSSPTQAPFINGENAYEDRWTLAIVAQVNPAVSTAMQFADTLTVGIIDVDVEYPPGGP